MTGSRYLIVVLLTVFLLVGTSSARIDVIDSLGGPVDTKAPTDPVMVKSGVATATNYAATFEDGVFTLHAGDVWITTGFEFNNAKFNPGYRADGVDNKFQYIGQFGEIDVHLTEGTIKEYVTVYRASDLPLKHPVTISPGAKLEPGPDGTFILYGPDGEPRVTIQKPFATDAGGKHFPLEYVWDGATLTTTGNLKGAKFPVVVDPSYVIDSTNIVGQYTSLALDSSGYPHISYYDDTNDDLKYAAWNGTAWNTETIDSTDNVGMHTSLALDSSGYPHISYYKVTGFDLKYAAWNGTAWNTETVDSTNTVGPYTSLALDSSGYPHISYYYSTNGDLKYAAWNGAAWNTKTVDSTDTVGQYTSLALDSSGYPHISYYHYTNGNLKYTAWNGTAWNTETIDSTDNVGMYTSLALDSSGYPHISYYHFTNGDLKYAAWNGTAWNTETVDSTNTVGLYTSLALDSSGYRHISYYDGTNRDLKYYTDLPSPTAAFSANQTTISEGYTVAFTDTSTGDMLFWQWDVDGDGGTDYTTQNCTHTYNAAGNYTVNLTVTNIAGSDTETKVDYITVTAADTTPPVAAFSANNTAPLTFENVLFTDESTGNPLTWNWSFDDGSINSTDQNPIHNWSLAGSYTITLSITNATGSDTEIKVDYITVSEPPATPTPTPTPVEGPNGTWVQQENFTFIYAGNNDPIPWPIWLVVVFITILFFVHSLLGTRYPDISGTIACVLAFTSAWASTMIGYVDVGVTGLNNTTLIIEPVIQTVRPEWLVYAMVMFALVALINNFYLIHKIYLKPKDWESLPRNKRYRG